MSGIDFTSIREIKILKAIDHPNIIKLKDVFIEKENIYLAMECLACDLGKIIDDAKVVFTEEDIVDIFKQILLGVQHLHKNWILHRVLFFYLGSKASKYSYGYSWKLQNH